MYENIDDGAFIGRKQYSVLMFKVNFLGLGLLSFFFSIYIYIYLKHNVLIIKIIKNDKNALLSTNHKTM
jgi:hypothetical protein